MRVTQEAAEDLATRAFLRLGVRPDMARDAAVALTVTEMMGIPTHGLARVNDYLQRLRAGGVNPDAKPKITTPAPALRLVDGENGLGAAVATRATQVVMEAAREVGVGAAFCRNSTHLGALAPHLLTVAQNGFAAIVMTNSAPMIAPAGGRQPIIGNSPIGIALPDSNADPIILDIALSVVARSKVRRAAEAGRTIPDTWATDAAGHPTTDAAEAMQGLMQAIGGAKGANLALMIDLLAGGLSGAAMLSDIPNANMHPEKVANVGHLFIVIDARHLLPPEALSQRLAEARSKIETCDPVDRDNAIRLPGARALRSLRAAQEHGFDIAPGLLDTLRKVATG